MDHPRGCTRTSERKESPCREEEIVLAIIAVVLLALWLMGFVAFHVSSGLIHLLLILALISVVAHLVRGRSAV
jgi:hypothetical protein